MATITLQDALVALNNSVTENGAATDAQLSDLYTEIINDEGETIDKQPLSRLRDLVFNYVIGDGLGELATKMNMYEPIEFEDYVVKNICVSNWGGHYIDGEITKAEAAEVATFQDKFRGNTAIENFNELKYFTGLTTLYISGNSTNAVGAFNGCTNLLSVKMPEIISNNNFAISGAFYNTKLVEVDMSPLDAPIVMHKAFHNIATLKKVVLPKMVTALVYTFRTCTKLTTIETTTYGSNWSNVTTFNGSFTTCTSLTTITGTITGINAAITFSDAPLTRASALVIINGLTDRTGSSQLTLTLSSTTKALLTDDDKAIATGKNWQIA